MAIIKCPECGKEISSNASACPNCGNTLNNQNQKFCKHCGEMIDIDCVVCPKCGKQVEELNNNSDKNIIINNNNNNNASASAAASASSTVYVMGGRKKNKWVALALCICTICGHKFYEGKPGMGILYLLTCGLFGIGWVVDIIVLALKPNPYYV